MKRILIIEDDIVIGNIYRRRFEMVGYDVEVAEDGVAGLAKAIEWAPDLVQIDLQLPKLNGVEVIKGIRARPELKTMPIVVLSSLYKSGSARDAYKAGATRCISKLECTPQLAMDIIKELLTAAPAAVPAPAPVPMQAPPAAVPAPAAIPQPAPVASPVSEPAANPDVRQEFLDRAPELRGTIRDRMNALIKSKGVAEQLVCLKEFNETIEGLSNLAAVTGYYRISHLAGALEVLLKELQGKPAKITGSTMRTIAFASDTLDSLCLDAPSKNENVPQSGLILSVDDEPIARRVLTNALKKTNLKTISLDDPLLALKVLKENQFDLIFLDADMPGMTGFELCKEIRRQPHNKTTPVIFVTSLVDFDSRAQSSLSGGNDLIAKPFLMIELAVKALTYLLKAKPQKEQASGASSAAAANS